jgi:hypothetical protein
LTSQKYFTIIAVGSYNNMVTQENGTTKRHNSRPSQVKEISFGNIAKT